MTKVKIIVGSLIVLLALSSMLLFAENLKLNKSLDDNLLKISSLKDKTVAQSSEIEKLKKALQAEQQQLNNDQAKAPTPTKPILKMRINIIGGMNADLVIDEIYHDYIVYRYYDYQHDWEPRKEKEKLSFEQIFSERSIPEDPSSIPMYAMEFFLDYGESTMSIKQDDMFDDKFMSDLDFRKAVVSNINKPVNDEVLITLNWKNSRDE